MESILVGLCRKDDQNTQSGQDDMFMLIIRVFNSSEHKNRTLGSCRWDVRLILFEIQAYVDSIQG